MFRNRKKYLYFILIFLLIVYILPNLINFREKRFFSEKYRLTEARKMSDQSQDSIQVIPGEYYHRSNFYNYFFGKKNRDTWTTPVKVKVFNYNTTKGGMTPFETGGSQQTISIRLKDSSGRSWVVRSVNKDQKNVLPWWLRPSIARSLLRDQVAAMNPYAAKVVADLSKALGLPHRNPEMYWMPYVEKYGEYNERIAGRLVYLEEYLDSSWHFSDQYNHPITILDTEDLAEQQEKQQIAIDTLAYLKTRLFDMLICDWDRHEDQWKWALVNNNGKRMFTPVAKDRDIAFYIFDEGIISKLAIGFNEKFQSFRKDFSSVAGLMKQSKELDRKILKGLPKHHYLSMAEEIKRQLTPQVIHHAFSQYPPAIYQQLGKQHEMILAARSGQLTSVAEKFYELVND